MIKAVIFDLDGTLIDGTDIVLGAFKHTLAAYGEPYDEVKVKTGIGRILESQYEVLAPNYDSKELASFHRAWQADNRHLYRTFPGFENMMGKLKKTGLKLGVFTSATRSRTDIAIKTLAAGSYFEVIVCGDEITNPKPDKEGIETAARLLHVSLDEVIMVGDAEHDILSGKNAGVTTVGITHGFGTKEALVAAGADYIVNNLQELLACLQKLKLDKD